MINRYSISALTDDEINLSVPNSIGRKEFIKKLSLLTGFFLASCTPLKVILKSYPDQFDEVDRKEEILKAFVTTIVPGADIKDINICKIFNDEFYGFNKFCGFFVSDLCDKSQEMFNKADFHKLSIDQRTRVVQAGLEDDSTTSKLYTAAIYMAQVSSYCSIYDDEKGCKLIGFAGNYGFMETEFTSKDFSSFLAEEVTLTGNYA